MPVRFPLSVCESIDSVQVYDSDPTAVNLAAYAIAASSERLLLWLDPPKSPPDPHDASGRVLGQLVDDGHHYLLRSPTELAPAPGVGDLSRWVVARPGSPDHDVGRLDDFLRLPEMVQRLLTEASGERRGLVLLLTNGDRISGFYPEDATSTQVYLRALKEMATKLVVGTTGLARTDRSVFDHIFRISRAVSGHWREARLTAEKGGAPLPRTDGVRLRDILEVEEAIPASVG